MGYNLVAGSTIGAPTSEQIEMELGVAICREEQPLNTPRKVTHSKGLLRKTAKTNPGVPMDDIKSENDGGDTL